MRYSTEPRRKYVEGYGFMSFARKFGDKYVKKLMDTGTKTGIDAAKTASERVEYNNWKTSTNYWWFQIVLDTIFKWNISSNVFEVVEPILNVLFFLFFYKKILYIPKGLKNIKEHYKALKSTKKHLKAPKAKNATK